MSEHITQQNREMAQVLAKIVADKHIWVEERKVSQPLESFQPSLKPSDRSFYDALSQGQSAFILECKKASPSKGLIRDDFDLDYIASVYKNHASAISVLTDEKYFQGSFDFLPQVRNQVTQPVLCKDFMIDTYQVYLARQYNADAILLMLSVLDDEQYQALAEVADSLNLGILTEVSNEEELERAIRLKARVVGINNRNLRDLSIDLNRTKELAPKLPEGTIVISESGIYNNQQVRDLANHADGFLIGSSLMSEDNLELAVRRVLLGENKVCGLTSPEDAAKAYQAGAVFGGLIFVEKSKRYVDLEKARLTMSGAPLNFVGVFQNHPFDFVAETASTLGLSAVQLHGDEDQFYVDSLRAALPEQCKIWKAYGVSESAPSLLKANVDRHLLDSKVGNQSGGTGVAFDWSLIGDERNIMLAGGLSPENAKEAASIGCLGLDLNSGVESAPGQKDQAKLSQAFKEIRNY
ncbi:Tryptophan biosynthesis protein trpCF (Includes: Indole-3-glycerol phosphate synthase; N-(5'-phospho-ribosyl)anthranilate isomerase) [Vibrio nigripulchritudo SO65]|uniref:bifunctional indole-3-glycerol-phosphate synthase TrpC/phosphoribosylanthranilate isomerase TrpF n=1 Tax=Vibrio nigripulchritudo TaxID=28173 RepID=UPI0003B22752|nr:bifunctional indole-3-glycerol-phosphate synthase TrpC/phosphoribosylanthranilate isomerase TrpF [Vibrio nigripulchritudo]CCN36193.1 Tryptophan biosynthesis protein trpCF (Includes: Indole-3-glycerol phosphate synthase; N-(5'-phospho-ribosyl)anthranilate isomerase) [Vibrio nigripulchritudo AM115]CCN43526.1 Tryptophan biosynthesis protein trpCF (Includes: Indole-3-glycerol phosphate synthase; N-(5'-phospho-ribosyl)anthranilate isomerase) [Vibrio nigripulchritudo FTn2]CCN66052.1 Tryptophan bios